MKKCKNSEPTKSQFNLDNLLLIAEYVMNLEDDKFDMSEHRKHQSVFAYCDSIGDILGHCTVLEPDLLNYKDGKIDFKQWSVEFTNVPLGHTWNYMFSNRWSEYDNTTRGAFERIMSVVNGKTYTEKDLPWYFKDLEKYNESKRRLNVPRETITKTHKMNKGNLIKIVEYLQHIDPKTFGMHDFNANDVKCVLGYAVDLDFVSTFKPELVWKNRTTTTECRTWIGGVPQPLNSEMVPIDVTNWQGKDYYEWSLGFTGIEDRVVWDYLFAREWVEYDNSLKGAIFRLKNVINGMHVELDQLPWRIAR